MTAPSVDDYPLTLVPHAQALIAACRSWDVERIDRAIRAAVEAPRPDTHKVWPVASLAILLASMVPVDASPAEALAWVDWSVDPDEPISPVRAAWNRQLARAGLAPKRRPAKAS